MTEEQLNEIVATIEGDADLNDAEEYRMVANIRVQVHIGQELTRIAEALENPLLQMNPDGTVEKVGSRVKFIKIPAKSTGDIHHINPNAIAEYSDGYVLFGRGDISDYINTPLKASEITALIKGGG